MRCCQPSTPKRWKTEMFVYKNGGFRKRYPKRRLFKKGDLSFWYGQQKRSLTSQGIIILYPIFPLSSGKACAQDNKKARKKLMSANASFDARFSFRSMDTFCPFSRH